DRGTDKGDGGLFAVRCAACREVFHSAPHPRCGLPVRCLPCADHETARLRRLATGRRQLTTDALLGFEALKRPAPTRPPRAARSAWPPAEAPLTRSLQGTRRPR